MKEKVDYPDLWELVAQLMLRIEKLEQERELYVKERDLMRIFDDQFASQARAVGGF